MTDNEVDFVDKPKYIAGWGSRVAHFRDPENNLIEICCELPREKWSEDLLEDIS